MHQGDGEAGDALPTSERSQSLSPSACDPDRRTHDRLQAFLHLVTPRRQPRDLGDDRAVHVSDLPTLGTHGGNRVGQQRHAVGAGEPFVGVRIALADVTQPRCSEQCVNAGVGHGVGVAVANEARAAELDAGQDHASARVVREGVDVESLAHPYLTHRKGPGVRGRPTGRPDV